MKFILRCAHCNNYDLEYSQRPDNDGKYYLLIFCPLCENIIVVSYGGNNSHFIDLERYATYSPRKKDHIPYIPKEYELTKVDEWQKKLTKKGNSEK